MLREAVPIAAASQLPAHRFTAELRSYWSNKWIGNTRHMQPTRRVLGELQALNATVTNIHIFIHHQMEATHTQSKNGK